jgi:hypothetical protein
LSNHKIRRGHARLILVCWVVFRDENGDNTFSDAQDSILWVHQDNVPEGLRSDLQAGQAYVMNYYGIPSGEIAFWSCHERGNHRLISVSDKGHITGHDTQLKIGGLMC